MAVKSGYCEVNPNAKFTYAFKELTRALKIGVHIVVSIFILSFYLLVKLNFPLVIKEF